jgi:hypothetical protein
MDNVIYLERAFEIHTWLLDCLQASLECAVAQASCGRPNVVNLKKPLSEPAFPSSAAWWKPLSTCSPLETPSCC